MKLFVFIALIIGNVFAQSITQLHCTFHTYQFAGWNSPDQKWLYETNSTDLTLDIINPYSASPLVVGNNGNSKLDVLGTFSQHSIASSNDGLPYQLVQWIERVGSAYLDDKQRVNIIVYEPKRKHIRYIKTYHDMNYTYIGSCTEL